MDKSTSETSFQNAIRYLRSHALAAHRLGDGLEVSHLASTGIRRALSISDKINNKQLVCEELLWCIVLGLYWTVDDFFGFVIERALSQWPEDGMDQATLDLITMLAAHVEHPHAPRDWRSFTYPTADQWQSWSSGQIEQTERLIGYTFLVELAWYDDPEDEIWLEVLNRLIATCQHLPWRHEFEALEKRLKSQCLFYMGRISLEPDAVSSLYEIEVELLKGWQQYFSFEHSELRKTLRRIRPLVSVDSSIYPSYFSLIHNSRFQLRDELGKYAPEDQFISLPRFRHVVSKQPSQVIADKREQEATDAAKELAIAEFSGDVPASKRWMRFRMAMLMQLQALRNWNIGEWFRGLSIRADARIDLAAFGYPSMVLDGFFDLLLARGSVQLEKSAFYQQKLRIADLTSEQERADFVSKILLLPKRYWRGVAEIIKVLSDAIPHQNMPQVIEWSLTTEKEISVRDFGVPSFLWMWKDILETTNEPGSIVQAIAPAIVRASQFPVLWSDLHSLFCDGIKYFTETEAKNLLEIMKSIRVDDSFGQFRFSVAYNSLTLRPELASLAETLLIDKDLKSPYQWLLLNEKIKLNDMPRPSSASKKALRSRILKFIDERADLKGPGYTLSSTSFFREMQFYSWSRSDRDLIDSLCDFIKNPNVLLTDKIDPLHCLRELIVRGPAAQSMRIVRFCLTLLQEPIAGRGFGFDQQGPMSNFRFNFSVDQDLFRITLDVIHAGIEGNELLITTELLNWLPGFGLTERSEFAPRILRLLLPLVCFHSKADNCVASILVGHVEAVFTAALMKDPKDSIYVFQNVMFAEENRSLWSSSKPTDLWRRTLLSQWANHLVRAVSHLSPEVRRVAAVAIARWISLKLEHSDKFANAVASLHSDPRTRVRRAIRKE